MIKIRKFNETENLIAYHGSRVGNIKEFNTRISIGDYGQGVYFTVDKDRAKEHGQYLYTCEIHLRNPLEVESKYEMNSIWDSFIYEKELGNISDDMIMQDYIKSKGFDSIVVENPGLGGDIHSPYYIAYDNNQIKIIDVERI